MQEIIEHYRAFNLAKKIMEKAHKNQTRVSGEPYKLHPIRCFNNYAALIGYLDEPETKCYQLEEDGIPFFGVVEVALLHDVIEDTPFTIEKIEKLFQEEGLSSYFHKRIKDALERITHDKTMDYPSYIEICMGNPISALCKMLDLQDNLYVLSLSKLDAKNYKRAKNYLKYIYQINNKYHFIERTQKYRQEHYQKKNRNKRSSSI